MKFKTAVTLLAVAAIVVSLIAGAVYFVQQKRQQELADQKTLVVNLYQQEKYQEAKAALRNLIPNVQNPEEKAELRATLLEVLVKTGEKEEAQEVATAIIRDYPQKKVAARAHYRLGRIALDNRKPDEARKHFNTVVDKFSDSSDAVKATAGLAEIKARFGELLQAKNEFDMLLEREDLDDETRKRIEKILGEVNTNLLLSRRLMPGDTRYKVQPGDTIADIAREHGLTPEVLLECNNISDPKRLTTNMRLKIPQVKFSILIDKWNNTLTLLNDGKFFKKYPVRTSRIEDETPVGEFQILNKKKDPRWNDPNTHKVYPPNHPENELGTRWMAFEGNLLGIHGTIDPESIGKYTSNGCVGMLKEDVEELFDLVTVGTTVKIVGRQNPALKESHDFANITQ